MTATINASTTAGVVTTADTSGILQLQTNGTAALTVDASQNTTLAGTLTTTGVTTFAAGTAAAPAITTTGDTNTGIFFPAADNIAFSEGGVEAMRITSTGDVGIGTSSPENINSNYKHLEINGTTSGLLSISANGVRGLSLTADGAAANIQSRVSGQPLTFSTNNAGTNGERARIDSSGNFLVAKTTVVGGETVVGCIITTAGRGLFTANAEDALIVSRIGNDGTLVTFTQAGTAEGTISVSGTTVSYNGGHLSRWAQTTTPKDDTLVKGTVLSNLDEMNVYTDADGNPVENEQLNKVKVSDVEGDANVAGVFVNWTHDDQHNVDEINMAMTGDMIIRIAQGTTVARGDLLMSAGDGTAKPQGDDIVRSKTVAKVTSTHVTCTYADGSYCVPCVLMAC